MFVNKTWKRLPLVLMFLLFALLTWSIFKNNLSLAGQVQTAVKLDRLDAINITIDKTIAKANAKLPDCPVAIKRSEVLGEIRNCAQGKKSSATVKVGEKTMVQEKK